jgi:hypothetical protein
MLREKGRGKGRVEESGGKEKALFKDFVGNTPL